MTSTRLVKPLRYSTCFAEISVSRPTLPVPVVNVYRVFDLGVRELQLGIDLLQGHGRIFFLPSPLLICFCDLTCCAMRKGAGAVIFQVTLYS